MPINLANLGWTSVRTMTQRFFNLFQTAWWVGLKALLEGSLRAGISVPGYRRLMKIHCKITCPIYFYFIRQVKPSTIPNDLFSSWLIYLYIEKKDSREGLSTVWCETRRCPHGCSIEHWTRCKPTVRLVPVWGPLLKPWVSRCSSWSKPGARQPRQPQPLARPRPRIPYPWRKSRRTCTARYRPWPRATWCKKGCFR